MTLRDAAPCFPHREIFAFFVFEPIYQKCRSLKRANVYKSLSLSHHIFTPLYLTLTVSDLNFLLDSKLIQSYLRNYEWHEMGGMFLSSASDVDKYGRTAEYERFRFLNGFTRQTGNCNFARRILNGETFLKRLPP